MIALEPRKLYVSAEVAAWLRHDDVAWFYRNKAQLRLEGFPLPVSRVGHPRWRGEDLNAWAARDKTPAVFEPGGNVVGLAAIAAARSKALMQKKRA